MIEIWRTYEGHQTFQGDRDFSTILRSTREMSVVVVGKHNLRRTRGADPLSRKPSKEKIIDYF
ncbi:hypothetical protein Syun_023100 [Stephania yunnanensis]|uniref:Uncharacterized protein n=1 Tax=Stephania yunnanensis TaxID=152371 RepID=A0AAP0F8Z4_9MAGN